MALPDYQFESRWRVNAPYDLVYDVLADFEHYSEWWPQVRTIEGIDESTAMVVCRSFLPYSLRFVLSKARDDRDAGVLEAAMHGDLDGWARWTVRPSADAVDLCYEQHVTTPGLLLRTLARGGRPLLRLNHAWMMRAGERGLRSRLRKATSANVDVSG